MFLSPYERPPPRLPVEKVRKRTKATVELTCIAPHRSGPQRGAYQLGSISCPVVVRCRRRRSSLPPSTASLRDTLNTRPACQYVFTCSECMCNLMLILRYYMLRG